MTRIRPFLARLLPACALALVATVADAQAPAPSGPAWRLGANALFSANTLFGPTLNLDLLRGARSRLALTSSAMWSISANRPFSDACEPPSGPISCSNRAAVSRLLSVGGEAQVALGTRVYLIGSASLAQGLWIRPSAGARPATELTGGIGVWFAQGRYAIEMRSLRLASSTERVNGVTAGLRIGGR